MDFDGFDVDNYVKGMKENVIDGLECKNDGCHGHVSEWDVATRDGECAECFWGRGPVGNF